LRTARLCSSRLAENSCEPSPRATKNSADPGAGCSAAWMAARPGQRDRRRWQAGIQVGIVRARRAQVLARQVAVETLAKAVDHGRIRLQQHAFLQTANEHARYLLPLLGHTGFLLYQRGHDQCLVGVRYGRPASRPAHSSASTSCSAAVRGEQDIRIAHATMYW
jgi:hypothetical protein